MSLRIPHILHILVHYSSTPILSVNTYIHSVFCYPLSLSLPKSHAQTRHSKQNDHFSNEGYQTGDVAVAVVSVLDETWCSSMWTSPSLLSVATVDDGLLLWRVYSLRCSVSCVTMVKDVDGIDLCRMEPYDFLILSTARIVFCLTAPAHATQIPRWFSTAAQRKMRA